ncbi:ribonuclease H-like domain-containing protein [Tanacetum coccineum]|uniref:Ribonuclease H-like domain-containing protein n=1 Tax=Tanacetum coccineum TaxID=301880 RepID=A0ABQ5IVW0_9ASTR
MRGVFIRVKPIFSLLILPIVPAGAYGSVGFNCEWHNMFRLVKRLRGMKKPLRKLLHAQDLDFRILLYQNSNSLVLDIVVFRCASGLVGTETSCDKPPKNKGQASGSEGSNIDQDDPLFLHSNDSNGVPLINFKLKETYSKQDASVIFNMHFKIHSLSGSGSSLSEHYYKFNALWRQYDSLDESNRSTQSHNVSKTSNGNIAFVEMTNPRNNNWFGSSNQPRKLNRPNLVCTHCNMNGHTADRCFELVGYPPNFKRNTSANRGFTSNNDVSGIKDQSTGSSKSFTNDLNKISKPKSYTDAASDIRWIEAMNQEMEALNRNGTWVITDLPVGRKPIGRKWVFKVKYKSSGEVERFKARLVAKCFNPKEEIDYEETFSPVVKMDLGKLKYFLGIEVLESKGNLHLTQRKCCLEVLAEFGMLPLRQKITAKPKKVVMDSALTGINNYQKLIGKLIYLTHTRPDISNVVHVLSHYMHAPLQSHLKLAFRILRLSARLPENQLLVIQFFGFPQRVTRLRQELDEVQRASDKNPSSTTLREEEAVYLNAFTQATLDEERYLKQKVKIEWLRSGILTRATLMTRQVTNEEIKDAMFSIGRDNSGYFYSSIKAKVDIPCASPSWNDIMGWILPIASKNNATSIVGRLIMDATSYYIWQERYNMLHSSGIRDMEHLVNIILDTVRLKLASIKFKKNTRVANLKTTWNIVDVYVL